MMEDSMHIAPTQSQSEPCYLAIEDLDCTQTNQPVPWGQLLTKTITIKDRTDRFVAFETPMTFNLLEEKWSAGRAENLNFVFKNHHLPPSAIARISKVHFRILRDIVNPLRPAMIEDCSRNGTFVNGRRVKDRRILKTNDTIAIVNPEYKIFVFQDLKGGDHAMQFPKIITTQYHVGHELGSGACGVVRLVYDMETCREYAMKQVMKNKLEDPREQKLNEPQRIMNEVQIMKSLQHPCIVRMLDIYDRPDTVYMVLELMRGGDMVNRISKTPQRRLPERTAKFYFVQMCAAIEYLHDKGITHRDIKPDNILLATDEEETLLKVTDFGLSKFIKKNSIMKTLCGTPQYVAPEVLTTNGHGSYTKKVDIWSLGCCLYACLSGGVPFTGADIQHIAHDIIRGTVRFDPVQWRNVSNSAINVVKSCLTRNPSLRPSIQELAQNQWLQDESVLQRAEQVMGIKLPRRREKEVQPQPQQQRAPRPQLTHTVGSTNRPLYVPLPVNVVQRTTRTTVAKQAHSPVVVPSKLQPQAQAKQPPPPKREYRDEPPLKRTRYDGIAKA